MPKICHPLREIFTLSLIYAMYRTTIFIYAIFLIAILGNGFILPYGQCRRAKVKCSFELKN